ncbi:multidrug efflux system membrane fusion protein [Azospirillum agricola]|uniref:efflux RND transporter periplasmic adaptor subunit n=1 Tax=Azospirillum agricola TaxID=1720247 RepID=UPI001AE86CD7|nr:efflux RND transporter periplasmic adaptor subunit [Azospirillum agricola]MBP2228609.1 multidrug efflux system membrane fusion protein [Azospirillum agricola]
MKIRWKPVVTGVVLVGLAGGVGYAVEQKLTAPARTAGVPGGPPGMPAPPGMAPGGGRSPVVAVQAGTVAREDVPIWFDGIGTVQAFNSVTVRARVDGELQRLDLREGQMVKAGDVLAVIDSRPLQAQLAQAQAKKAQDEAQLANTRRDLERNMNLKEFASKQTVDTQRALVAQWEAQIRADEAAIEAVRVQLNYTTVTAPISGRIGLRNIDNGNVVRASDQNGIVTITQIQPIAVVFTLPEKQLPAILDAQARGEVPVQALDREGRAQLGAGALQVIDNLIDSGTGTIRLKATLPNEPQRLWPGQFVNVRLLSTVRRGATTVPATVVQRGPQGTFAYIVKDDQTVEQRPIKVGHIEENRAIVESGLTPGERVVVDGQYRLQPGSRVRIVDPAAAQPMAGAPSAAAPAGAPPAMAGQSGGEAPVAREERHRERGPRDPNNPDAPRRRPPSADGSPDGAGPARSPREPS